MKIPAKGFTHGGKFHADDVFSTALLQIVRPDIQVTRGFVVPDDFDGIVYDVGGGMFDHHQEPRETRPNGVPYAAFGLLWQVLGAQLVGEHQARLLDENFIQPLDLNDNTGEQNSLADAIGSFNPLWDSKDDPDECFWRAVPVAKKILENEIAAANAVNRADDTGCEEGELEYDPSRFAFGGVHVAQIEDKSELTPENLTALEKKSGCGRVIIEYNGMWLVQELYDAMPDNWLVYQCLATADGTTIKTYAGDNAMRGLLLDKLRGSELLVVNRAEAVNDDESRQLIHKLVRQASRRCDIAYEFKDGSVAYDDIPDPLPFDINAPVIEIPEEFFGVWYMDCMDDPKKYDGKTVKYLAQVCQTPQAGKGAFVPGRFAMTCCVQDIQFVGMPCKYDDYKSLEQRSWITITAKINVKYHPIYKGQTPDSTGPVLTALSVEPAEKPAQDVVMFS